MNWSHQNTEALNQAARDGNDRTLVLPGFQQFFPSANPDNILPNASFTGGSMPGTIAPFNTDNRWPFFGYNTLWNFSGNVTKIKGSHNMKAGMFVEHTTRPAQRASFYNGSLSFNVDGSNPLNTNLGYANGLLGAVTQYQESDGHPSAHGLFMNTEFYAQDNWRVKRNFTIDAGHPLLLHHADAEQRRHGRRVRPDRVQRVAGAAAVSADEHQRRPRRR